jgi:LysR family hydrogen peroxide-inducible transcriptional activator
MNIRDLEYLVAVSEHQHFGRAAEACFVSQPGLSIQLKKMSDVLGVKIFEQDKKKKLITTPAGEQIIQQARQILSQFEVLKSMAKAEQNLFERTITVGIFPTLAPYVLPVIAPLLTKKYPQLKILWQEKKTDELVLDLKEGRLDAALLADFSTPESLTSLPLFNEPFYLAVAQNHPLAKRKTIELSDLHGQELLLLEDGHCLKEQALKICHLNGASMSPEFRATSLETLRYMIAANGGITLMPHLAKKSNDSIHYIAFRKSKPERHISLFFRQFYPQPKLFEALADLIKQKMKGVLP